MFLQVVSSIEYFETGFALVYGVTVLKILALLRALVNS